MSESLRGHSIEQVEIVFEGGVRYASAKLIDSVCGLVGLFYRRPKAMQLA